MFEATTIVAITRNGEGAMAGDGQVTVGQNTIMKGQARKVRRIYEGKVVAGFAGSVADAFTLFAKFEDKLREHSGNLTRAAVEVAREWRSDRVLRHLEAMMIVMSADKMLLISGTGEVIEPDDGILAIGSGGTYALAAARALCRHTELTVEQIVTEAMKIAAEICVFTNDQLTVEKL
ncbi:MAG: ATP-dependent protease subunit HslV [Methylocystaceae bacterium]